MEVLKLLLDIGTPAIGKLVHYDALATTMRNFTLNRDPQCALCGDNPTINEIKEMKLRPSKENNGMKEINVVELKNKLDNNQVEFLLDVRMEQEFEAANLGGFLIPLPELMENLDSIPRDKAITIHCKAGGRSARACATLLEAGFSDVTNVLGGTDAWRQQVDPTLPPA